MAPHGESATGVERLSADVCGVGCLERGGLEVDSLDVAEDILEKRTHAFENVGFAAARTAVEKPDERLVRLQSGVVAWRQVVFH